MRRPTTFLAAALAVAALAVAGPAFGKGGGGGSGSGGGTPAPAPAPVEYVDYCAPYYDFGIRLSDGSSQIANNTTGGCVIVRSYPALGNRLEQVVLAPGWGYTVLDNGSGTKSRVRLTLTQASTGREIDVLVEAGKTVIR